MPKSRFPIVPVLITALFAVLVVFGWGALRKYQMDSSSEEVAIALLESTLSTGTADLVIDTAHPDWLAAMPAPAIRSYLETSMAMLGPLQAMTSITGNSTASFLPLANDTVDANYVVSVEMGSTLFDTNIDLRLQDGEWFVTSLVLNAELLME